jgi:hypothetical protein
VGENPTERVPLGARHGVQEERRAVWGTPFRFQERETNLLAELPTRSGGQTQQARTEKRNARRPGLKLTLIRWNAEGPSRAAQAGGESGHLPVFADFPI